MNLDLRQVIDMNVSCQNLSTQLHSDMLARMEENSLNTCMEQISTSIVLNDWDSINEAAQSLQSTSGFIGAGRLYYACHYIQEA